MLVTILASAIPPASATWQKLGDINPPYDRAETYYEGFQSRSSISQKKSYAYADTSGYIETAVAIRNEEPDTPGWQAEAKAWVDGLITTPSAPSPITNVALKWWADVYGHIYIACEVKIDFVVIVYDQYWSQKGTWTFTKYNDWHIPGQSAKEQELNENGNLYQLNLAGLSLQPNTQYRFRLIAHNQVKMLYGSYHGYTYSGYGQIFSDFSGSYDLTVGQFRPSWMSPNPNWRMKINKMEVWGDVSQQDFTFTLSANPSSITVQRGSSATTTVTVTKQSGTAQTVSLSISGWGGSSGLTASFNPSSGVPNNQFSSTLTISASSSASLGSFTVTVWGGGGSWTSTTAVTVTVTDFDFSISASPSSLTVDPGGTAAYGVTCTLAPGSTPQTVSLSASYASGVGLSHSFSPSSGNPTFTSTLYMYTSTWTPANTYTITITGTGGGKTRSTSVNLVVQAGGVSITIASNPSGRQVTVDGYTYTAPVTFNWQQGSAHTLSASSPQSGGSGIQYVWASWSDGGAQTHTYTTPSSSQTVTANFKTQYQLTISVASGGSSNPAPGSYWYDSGSSASVTANPPSGYVTAGWVLDGGAGKLKHNPNTGAIYYIYSNTKYWITSMDVYHKYGFVDNVWVSDPNVESLPSGYNLDGSNPLPDASTSISVTMNAAHTVYTSWVSPPSNTVTITFQLSGVGSDASGTILTIDGAGYSYSTFPKSFTWTISSTHSVVASTPVSAGSGKQYVFKFWTNGDGLSGASGVYTTPTSSQTVEAKYKTQYQLTMQVNPAGGGSTSPAVGSYWYDSTLPVSISATAASGYAFSSWTGSGTGSYSGTDNPKTITMNGPITETANFQPSSTTVLITITSSPAGSGFVKVDDVAITTPRTFEWTIGSSHKLEALSPVGGGSGIQYIFQSWSDGGAQSHTYTVPSSSQTVTANFKTQYQLTMQVNPVGGGSTSPAVGSYWYDSGSPVSISATPASGYTFSSWSGSGSGSYTGSTNQVSITMNAPITETANFQGASYTVTVYTRKAGDGSALSGVQVTFGSQTKSTDSSGNAEFSVSAGTYSLSVSSPVSGGSGIQYVFTQWTDGNTQNPRSITVSASVTYDARYKTQYYLTMQVNPSGAGTVSPSSGWYDAGSSVSISATPSSGYAFSSWSGIGSGSYSGTDNPKTITMNGPITETANFQGASYTVTVYARRTPDASTISGVQVTFGSQTKSTDSSGKAEFSVSAGTYSLSVQSPTSGGSGIQYVFWYWMPGGSSENPRSITVSASVTFDAMCKPQYYLTIQVSPSGAGTVSPSSGWRDAGSSVPISATPASGYQFQSWSGSGSGSYSGTANPASVTMNGPITETANFQPSSTTVSITITSSPTGSGFVKVDGAAITTPQTFTWTIGSSHTLEALSPVEVGGTRYAWVSWSDGGGQSHTYTTPSSSQTVTANFNATQYLLTVRTSGLPASAGSTKVYINGVAATDDYGVSQINDGSANGWRKWYNVGVTVQVNIESPVGGYAFSQWSGDATGSSRPVSIALSPAKTVTANYGSAPDSVSVDIVNPSDGSTVSGIVAIKATVVDSLGHPITSVQYRIDSGSWQPMTWDGAFWTASWDTSSASNGQHSITVKGTCSQGASGQDAVTVNVNNAAGPQYTFYINYAESPSGVWYPEDQFLPSETMGVKYNVGDPNYPCRIVVSSSNILYTPKSPSATVDIYSDSGGYAKATFTFDLAKAGIYGSYTVTWFKLKPGGNPSNPADWLFVYTATFNIRGAKAESWSVSHSYDRASVNAFIRWDGVGSSPVLNRNGTLEVHSRFGPYNTFIKGLTRKDGSVSVEVPYYDWKGQVTFELTYSGTAIDVKKSDLQRNLKTFTYDVLALSYTCEGNDYVMTAHLTYFLKYDLRKVQGVQASLQCPETGQPWELAPLTDANGYTSPTITITATSLPTSFRLNAWAYVKSPLSALRDYIIAVQYTSITIARENIAVQASITGAQLSGGYFKVKTTMTSGCQWMDLTHPTVRIKVEVWSGSQLVAQQTFSDKDVIHGVSNNIDLQMTGVGGGTYTVKVTVQYGETIVGQTQKTVSV